MRLLLTGDKVSYHGKYVNFDNVGLGWKPIRPNIPFYVPATASVGLRLAGEIGDGVVLNAVCSPEYTVNALKIIKASAEKAGRDFSKFEVAQIINCSVEDDHKKALDAMRWKLPRNWTRCRFHLLPGRRCGSASPTLEKKISRCLRRRMLRGYGRADQSNSGFLCRRDDRQRHSGRSEKAGAAVPRRGRENSAPTARGSASNPTPVRSICPVTVQGSRFKVSRTSLTQPPNSEYQP